MYDFHKVKRSVEEIKFKHKYFQRDRADLLSLIKRKTNRKYIADDPKTGIRGSDAISSTILSEPQNVIGTSHENSQHSGYQPQMLALGKVARGLDDRSTN